MTSRPIVARRALNDYARNNDPFAKLGKTQISDRGLQRHPRFARTAFGSRGPNARYDNGSAELRPSAGPRFSVVIETPRDAERLRKNPLGVYVHAINWSKELGSEKRA